MSSDKNDLSNSVLCCFDLDGTLRETVSGEEFINDPNDQQPTPGSIGNLNHLRLKFFDQGLRNIYFVGITNQKGVKLGYKSLESCILEQRRTLEIFPQLLEILFCPDNGKTCWMVGRFHYEQLIPHLQGTYRKPQPGMLKQASIRHPALEENCYMIGDQDSDKEAAEAAGFKFWWASDWLKGSNC